MTFFKARTQAKKIRQCAYLDRRICNIIIQKRHQVHKTATVVKLLVYSFGQVSYFLVLAYVQSKRDVQTIKIYLQKKLCILWKRKIL